MENYNCILISDSLGETVRGLTKATMQQFPVNFKIKQNNHVRTPESVIEIFEKIDCEKPIIVFTTVIDEVKNEIIAQSKKRNIPCVDALSHILDSLTGIIKQEPSKIPGALYSLDDEYFKRIEAIEFAVKYDDGRDLRGLKHADIVLIGISRTSKTPLSMYLSHKNIKVANVPLVPEIPIAPEIYKVDKKKLIGLTNSPEKLNEIRMERLKAMGLSGESEYAQMDRIIEEIDYAEKVYSELGCPIINVANKAIEETASIIIDLTGQNVR